MSRTSSLRGFGDDRRGAVAILAVMVIGVVFAMAALSIDVSRFYLLKRGQQMVTDLAAVAAAANLGNVQAAALANLAANGHPASELVSIELGTYTGDPSVPAAQRFVVGTAGSPNAARVTLRSAASSAFGGVLAPIAAAVPVISTQSVAVNRNTADFSIGSTLASFDGGLANAILGGLIGSNVSLSAMDYQGLASANVDLFGLANALAIRIGATSLTYGSLVTTSVRLADLLSAMADAGAAAGMPYPSVTALRTLAAAAGVSGPTVTLGSIASFAAYASLPVGSSAPVAAPMPALALATAAARAGVGTTNIIQANLGATVPGVLGATLKIAIGAQPVGSSFSGIGPVGTTVHTAQTRILLTLQLAGLGAITGLNLPLYVEVAPATGRIASMSCSAGAPVDPPVTLGVTPGVVDAWIGAVSNADFTNMASAPNPGVATLTNLLLVQVMGRAHATMSNLSETLVPFTSSDIAAGTMKATATTDYTSSLLSQLIGTLQLSASLLGVNVAVPAGTNGAIAQLLQTELQPIDTELSNTLAMLGLTIGSADSWVRGVGCGGGALVN